MASIEKRGNSYRVAVYTGKDQFGVKQYAKDSWTPPPDLTPAKQKAALAEFASKFEARVRSGHYLSGERTTFGEFVEMWFSDYAVDHLKPKTLEGYRQLLDVRILPALGHIKLSELQPTVLISFIKALKAPGLNLNVRMVAVADIRDIWKESGLTALSAKIDRHFLTTILTRRNVSYASAAKFARVLRKKVKELFTQVGEPQALSTNTIAHHLRVISTILSTAVEWQVIEANPCERVKAPKLARRKIKFLEIDQVLEIVKAASQLDDIRVKIAVLVFIYTGLRKSELAGLQWPDIDLDAETISVNRIVQQLDGQGLVVGTPKTDSGERQFAISSDLIEPLREFKEWQKFEEKKSGDQWQRKDRQLHQEKSDLLSASGEGPLPEFQPVPWVFAGESGYPLHPSTIYHWVKDFMIECGHPDMTVHGLRHSNLSLLLATGVDLITVSRRAGHAKPSITSDFYGHALKRPDAAAAATLNKLLRPSSKDTPTE